MKKVFKKQLFAVILMIAMVLGIFPIVQPVRVGAATTHTSTLLFDPDFKNDVSLQKGYIDAFVKKTYGGSSTTTAVNVYQKGFIKAWNDMPDNQAVVVIDTHGTPTSFKNMEGNEYFNTSQIKQLKSKTIGYIVLLGCNCGHYYYRTQNIARAFADKFNCPVIAADGTVDISRSKKYIFFGDVTGISSVPVGDNEWKDLAVATGVKKSSLNLCFGWMVYIPKNSSNNYQGKLYQMGRCNSTVNELLTQYYKNQSLDSKPVK